MPELHPMTSLALYAAVCGLVIVECGLASASCCRGTPCPLWRDSAGRRRVPCAGGSPAEALPGRGRSVAWVSVLPLAVNVLDAQSLIQAFGAAGIFLVLFAETGLLIGFFLPGDSLLFTAGVLCAASADAAVRLNLALILPGVAIAAILGAQLGYLIGRRAGPVIFDRPQSRLFNPANVKKAEVYFERFGPAKAVVLARFVPIVRTFLNPVAGVLEMPVRQFTLWNVVGGVIWSMGVTLLGYALGKRISNIDTYLLPIIALILVVSVLPVLFEVLRHRRAARR